jgi:hypothetical protein
MILFNYLLIFNFRKLFNMAYLTTILIIAVVLGASYAVMLEELSPGMYNISSIIKIKNPRIY